MLQATLTRVSDPSRFAAPMLVCNEEHRFLVAEQARAAGIEPSRIVLEPMGRNTGPAVAIAALLEAESDPDALMLVLPSDHVIKKTEAFIDAVDKAAVHARNGRLMTFGITPDRPETGYGYIACGPDLEGDDQANSVTRFVEKPDLETAESYLADGNFVWNSGMFLFSANAMLAELDRLEADLIAQCRKVIAKRTSDLDFCRLPNAEFETLPNVAIDVAVMEKTDKAGVVKASMGWSDVGSWAALWDVSDKDGNGNAIVGDVLMDGASNCYVRSEKRLVVAIDVTDLVIVETDTAVAVMSRDAAQRTKDIVDKLKASGRLEATENNRVYRPWGFYETIDTGDRFQVKHIQVKPGAKLSLQKHHHRAEHWVVVNGTARIVRGNDEVLLSEDQSTYIPLGTVHRLENPGKIPLDLIEVQSGAYLGEDDIVRLEDTYNRTA